MAKIKFIPSVHQVGVEPQVWFAVGVAAHIYNAFGKSLVVTSMKDGHNTRPKSLHHKGLAVDLRTRHLSEGMAAAIHGRLNSFLNPYGFDVILETDPPHIHIEYDPKLDASEDWQQLNVV